MLEKRFLEKRGANLINFEESEMVREVAEGCVSRKEGQHE